MLPSIVTKEYQQSVTPAEVLQILKDGNQRFIKNERLARNIEKQRQNLLSVQHPIAVILGCIDSRVPSELIFDLGLGDVFNIRVAGNILNDDVLGSLEFACKIVGAKLVVIMGHTDCGAIRAACNGVRMEHISSIMEKIDPIVQTTPKNENVEQFVLEVTHQNTVVVKNDICKRSKILKEMQESGAIEIVSAVYNIQSGIVEFDEN